MKKKVIDIFTVKQGPLGKIRSFKKQPHISLPFKIKWKQITMAVFEEKLFVCSNVEATIYAAPLASVQLNALERSA